MDRLLPTQDALNQHIQRAYIQAQVWSSSYLAIIPEKKPTITNQKRLAMGLWLPDGQTGPKPLSPVQSLYDPVAISNAPGAATVRADHFTTAPVKSNEFLYILVLLLRLRPNIESRLFKM